LSECCIGCVTIYPVLKIIIKKKTFGKKRQKEETKYIPDLLCMYTRNYPNTKLRGKLGKNYR